jgi:hypothetical protein
MQNNNNNNNNNNSNNNNNNNNNNNKDVDGPKRGGSWERNIFTHHEEVLLVQLVLG